MAVRTYLFGYGSGPWGASLTRRTREWIEAHPNFGSPRMHPELMRRLFALADAAQDAGTDLGFGGGARNPDEQEDLFKERHFVVPCPGGIIRWNGQCWQRYDWAASAAPPGRSYHEFDATPLGAIAVDMVGDHAWATPRTHQYGLRNWLANEPWHYQPYEVPNARVNYTGTPLTTWDLPDTPGDEMIEGIDVRIDTRTTNTPFTAGEQRKIMFDPRLPAGTKGLFMNVVVVAPDRAGFLTAWTAGPRPEKSFVNYNAGQPTANGFTYVELSGFGTFELYSVAAAHVVIDFVGAVV